MHEPLAYAALVRDLEHARPSTDGHSAQHLAERTQTINQAHALIVTGPDDISAPVCPAPTR